MKEFIFSTIATCLMFISDEIYGMKKKLWVYVVFFITMFSSVLLYKGVLQANECSYIVYGSDKFGIMLSSMTHNEKYAFAHDLIAKGLTDEQRKKYTAKYKDSKKQGEWYYKQASERCWWIPCPDDREVTRAAVRTFITGVVTLAGKASAALLIVDCLTEYTFACMDEWEIIREQFLYANYHFENADWYKHVLDNA